MSERELEKENTVVWKDRKHFLWFPWSFVKYSIENGRLIIRSGLFNSTVEETLLYRIVDISMKQTLWGKLFGTGDICKGKGGFHTGNHTEKYFTSG